jgi:hypothetical protein
MKEKDIITFKKYFPLLTELEKSHPDFGTMNIEVVWYGGELRKALVSDKTQRILFNEARK